MLDKVISLFEIVKEITSEFHEGEFQGQIAIASTHGIIDAFFPTYIAKFRNEHPKVSFHLTGGVYESVFERVESAAADFGVCYLDSVPDSLTCHELFECGMVLLTRKGNKFFPGNLPTLKELAETPIILFSRTGSMEPYIARRFAQAKLQPNIVLTNNNPVSVKKYVAMGIGAALVSGLSIEDEDKQKFDIYSMDRYFPKRKYGLLLRKHKYPTPYVRTFIRSIKPDIKFDI